MFSAAPKPQRNLSVSYDGAHDGRVAGGSVRQYRRDMGGGPVTAESVQLGLPMSVEEHGEIRLYRFVLPYLPPSKNVYDNWPGQWKSSAKRKWEKDLRDQCESFMVPKGNPVVGLAATLVFGSKARRDPQNYAQALWHWVPDGLVKCGVLLDDNEGRVQIGPNWGLTFGYDLRTGIPKKRREHTVLALTMRSTG